MFTQKDLNNIVPEDLKSPPITYAAIIKLVRDYDLNPVGLAVACLNIGYYLGRNESGSAAGPLNTFAGPDEVNEDFKDRRT